MSRKHLPWYLLAALFALPIQADEPKGKKAVLETVGYVVPIRLVTVSAPAAGQIVQVNAEEGAVVRKGDLLARLEAAPFQASLRAAVARLEGARARLAKVEESGIKLDIAMAEADVARSAAEVEKAEYTVS